MRMKIFYAVLALFFTMLFAACTVSGDEQTIGNENAIESVTATDDEDSDESSDEEDESSEDDDDSDDSGHNSGGNKGKVSASCPDDYPLLDEDGNCHSCDDDDIFRLHDEDDCERICTGKNGTTKRVDDFWGCKLEKCPAHKPLEDAFGKCRSCDYDGPVFDTKNCSKCPERSVQNSSCFFKSCSDRPLMSHNGYCYPCSTKLSVETYTGECISVCPKRVEAGTWSESHGLKTEDGVLCNHKDWMNYED